jgi:monoamine oxidase
MAASSSTTGSNLTAQRPDEEFHSVIVVGAGIAGLYAGVLLKQQFNSDVLICEAQDRVGGRIMEVRLRRH